MDTSSNYEDYCYYAISHGISLCEDEEYSDDESFHDKHSKITKGLEQQKIEKAIYNEMFDYLRTQIISKREYIVKNVRMGQFTRYIRDGYTTKSRKVTLIFRKRKNHQGLVKIGKNKFIIYHDGYNLFNYDSEQDEEYGRDIFSQYPYFMSPSYFYEKRHESIKLSLYHFTFETYVNYCNFFIIDLEDIV